MLAACYLVHGGEPLQTDEFIFKIRQLAAKEGYNKYEVVELNARFDWEDLLNKCQSLDLFADKVALELRLHGDDPGKQGSMVLDTILSSQTPNFCIIVRANKLKTTTLSSNWVNQIRKSGEIHLAKPVPANQWVNWVQLRLTQAGFKAERDATEYLARSYEGNLVATSQAIQKIQTALPAGVITLEQIKPFIEHSSHFTVFDLLDAIKASNSERVFYIFNTLDNDGTEPLLILWAVAREIRNLPITAKTKKLLQVCAKVDLMIKGMAQGNAKETLLLVCLSLTSSKTLIMEELTIC